ncbi:MAG: polysaccharide biosynthesis/export family protein [Novosphingobium sp.]
MRVIRFLAILLALACPAFAVNAAAQSSTVVSSGEPGIGAYLLGPGDKLRVIVFNEPNLSGEFSVSDSGQVAFPLIGSVDVNGKTVAVAQEAIRTMLADGYLNAPEVSLEVLRYRPYYIYGEIIRAGEYPFASGLTVQQAIAAAGGYSYRAARKYVYLRRTGQDREAKLKFKKQPQILVMPGDTIRIGGRSF